MKRIDDEESDMQGAIVFRIIGVIVLITGVVLYESPDPYAGWELLVCVVTALGYFHFSRTHCRIHGVRLHSMYNGNVGGGACPICERERVK
jgi:hypothetical protein